MFLKSFLTHHAVAAVLATTVVASGGVAAAGAAGVGPLGSTLHTHSAHHHHQQHAAVHARHAGRHESVVVDMRPFAVAAKVIGVRTSVLVAAFHNGESIAAFAAAHGVSPATVEAALQRADAAALARDHAMMAAARASHASTNSARLVARIVDGTRGAVFHHAHPKASAKAASHAAARH